MKKSLSIIAVLTCLTACIYPYRPDLDDAPEGVLVVDGNLLIGESSTVYLGSMFSLWPKPVTPEDNPGGGGFYYASGLAYPGSVYVGIRIERVWAEDDAGGIYEGSLTYPQVGSSIPIAAYYSMLPYSLPTENAPTDRQYRLCVQADGLLYTSDWTRPLAAPVIKDISFRASDETVYVGISMEGGAEATGYTLLSFEETWRFHTDYYPNYEYVPESNSVIERRFYWDRYWCWKHLVNESGIPIDYTAMSTPELKDYPFYSFSRYDNRNHQQYSILVKARTIDKQTYKYLSHLEESLHAGDNLFTPNPGEIPGNIRCETEPDRMVLGYVTVALSTSKRAYLDSRYQLSRPLSPYALVYPLQYGNMAGENSWRDFYSWGYMPLIDNTLPNSDPTQEGPYGWGSMTCYDCIAAGGTLDRPDFWED